MVVGGWKARRRHLPVGQTRCRDQGQLHPDMWCVVLVTCAVQLIHVVTWKAEAAHVICVGIGSPWQCARRHGRHASNGHTTPAPHLVLEQPRVRRWLAEQPAYCLRRSHAH